MDITNPADLKTCEYCHVEKTRADFFPHRNKCRRCTYARHKELRDMRKAAGLHKPYDWKAKYDPERQKWHQIKFSYKLSKEQYEAIAARQDHKCPICERGDVPMVIDHCHETKAVRGLLCRRCNSFLGQMGDNVVGVNKWFTNITGYLQ